jgi:hypothetical protein
MPRPLVIIAGLPRSNDSPLCVTFTIYSVKLSLIVSVLFSMNDSFDVPLCGTAMTIPAI